MSGRRFSFHRKGNTVFVHGNQPEDTTFTFEGDTDGLEWMVVNGRRYRLRSSKEGTSVTIPTAISSDEIRSSEIGALIQPSQVAADVVVKDSQYKARIARQQAQMQKIQDELHQVLGN
jgi:hypothetical protein